MLPSGERNGLSTVARYSGVSVFKLYHADDDTPPGRGCLFLGPGKTRIQQHQEKNEEKTTSLGEAAML